MEERIEMRLTKDQQRRALIYAELKRQCKSTPSYSDNEEIFNKVCAAGLLPQVTPDDILRAVHDFEMRRLMSEIEEMYFEHFWFGEDEDNSWMYVVNQDSQTNTTVPIWQTMK